MDNNKNKKREKKVKKEKKKANKKQESAPEPVHESAPEPHADAVHEPEPAPDAIPNAISALAAAAHAELFEKMSVKTDIQLFAIYKSIKQNFPFYIVLILCLLSFTKCTYNKSNSLLVLISMVFVSFCGYAVHLVSHYLGTTMSEMYKSYDNIFTRNKYINWLAIKAINFGEFHAKTHHDTEVNKSAKNISLEIINNIVTQGGALIILKFLLGLLDNRVILLWALFYATVHNINYNISPPRTHQEHHLNDKTNYGIDIWDIIVGSKYNWDNIETHNHAAINLIVITAGIYYVSNKFKL